MGREHHQLDEGHDGVVAGQGTEKFQHVLDHFVETVSKESFDAEADLITLRWDKAFGRDSLQLKAYLEKVWMIVARFPEGRGGIASF